MIVEQALTTNQVALNAVEARGGEAEIAFGRCGNGVGEAGGGNREMTVRRARRMRRRALRQRQPMIPRLEIDEIVNASRYLNARDAALVAAVYERGVPLKGIALVNRTPVGRLHRRLRGIIARLRSPLFRYVLREHHHWPADRRAIAQASALRGESQQRIADTLGLSLHDVRMELARLKALASVGRD